MKKILFCISSFSRVNGVASFFMNQYDSIIKTGKYSVDFLTINNTISDNIYLEKIKSNNGIIFELPKTSKLRRFRKTYNYVKKILKQVNYDIIHVNLIDVYACSILKAAKDLNIKNRIYHVHNPLNNVFPKCIRKLMNKFSIRFSNCLCACSECAGKSNFRNEEFFVLNNLIDVEKFSYNELARNEIREKYGVNKNETLLGGIGRLVEQKNPLFMIKLIKKLSSYNTIKLMWIGNGKLKKEIEKIIKSEKLENKIILIDSTFEIYKYYSAFDMFVLPSIYEGFGIVLIEAQASGVKILTSPNVPNIVKETDLVKFIDLTDEELWEKAILDFNVEENNNRIDYNYYMIQKSKFSLKNHMNFGLKDFYDRLRGE